MTRERAGFGQFGWVAHAIQVRGAVFQGSGLERAVLDGLVTKRERTSALDSVLASLANHVEPPS